VSTIHENKGSRSGDELFAEAVRILQRIDLRPSFTNLRSPFTGDAVMQTWRSGRDGRLRDWKFWKLEKFFEV
jgi:hypothetical protein